MGSNAHRSEVRVLFFQINLEMRTEKMCRNSSGCLIGVVPLYLKSHSYGEYVFVRTYFVS